MNRNAHPLGRLIVATPLVYLSEATHRLNLAVQRIACHVTYWTESGRWTEPS